MAWALLAGISAACWVRTSAAALPCHYGVLPGGWIFSSSRQQQASLQHQEPREVFPVWQPYKMACQLQPLLLDYLQVRHSYLQCLSRRAMLSREAY